MKVNEIERLLARYYDGETSDTEEKELKRFFTEEDVPAHLLAEKEIFMQLAAHPDVYKRQGVLREDLSFFFAV